MQIHRARPWLASLLAFLASVFTLETAESEPIFLLPAAFPLLAALLFHVRKMQAQVIARAAIWTVLVLNMLIAHLDHHPKYPIAMVVSGALALLVAGRVADSSDLGSFRPVAYQRTLMLSLVLALADTFTMWMWTAFAMLGGAPAGPTLGFLVCATVTLISVIGLYRLRMWGLVLNVLANIGIAIAFSTGIVDVQELRIVFVAAALVQLLLALPVFVGVIRRRPLELPLWLQRSSRVLFPIALLAVIALAIQPLFGRSILVRIAEWWLH